MRNGCRHCNSKVEFWTQERRNEVVGTWLAGCCCTPLPWAAMSAALRCISGANLLAMCSSCMSDFGMPNSAIDSGGVFGRLTGMTTCREYCCLEHRIKAVTCNATGVHEHGHVRRAVPQMKVPNEHRGATDDACTRVCQSLGCRKDPREELVNPKP
jgi:hypothetical protein